MKNNELSNKYLIKKLIDKHRINHILLIMLLCLLITLCYNNLTGYCKVTDAMIKDNKTTESQIKPKNDIYGIGSVSKMFAAVAVMKLVDEGKIDLDKPLTYYIPEFSMADERYQQITPKMLLNHSSGLMGTTNHNEFLYGYADTSYHDSFLEQLKNQSLKAAPGDYSVYCNDGFTLAEILVERVSGMSFSEYVKKEISSPLELDNTFTPKEDFKENKLASIYFDQYTLPAANCQGIASGGIYGTPTDLCKFAQIFMKDNTTNILSKKSVELMSKPWYRNDKICVSTGDSQFGYGLGWDCVNTYPYNLYGIQALSKGGDIPDYHTNLTVLPEQNLSIAITTSGGSSTYCEEAAQDIILEVLKAEGIIKEVKDIKVNSKNKVEIAPLPEEMKQYEGYYISNYLLKAEFNDAGTLLLTPQDSKYDTVQEYVYTKSGEFISTKGYYFDGLGNLVSNENGNKGFAKLKFRKESNGKEYLIGTSYESTNGLGEMAITIPFAEKIKPNVISDTVLHNWAKREGKKYYLSGEIYNSLAYLEDSMIDFRLTDGIPGYVTMYNKEIGAGKCRIIDENTAKCESDLPTIGSRDLKDYTFSKKGEVEYALVGSYTYIGEEAVKSSKELTKGNIVIGDDLSAWYKISKEDASTLIQIDVPNHGAYYVYDKNDTCIGSSIFKNNPKSVVLPEDGYIVFAGKEGTVFHINKGKN